MPRKKVSEASRSKLELQWFRVPRLWTRNYLPLVTEDRLHLCEPLPTVPAAEAIDSLREIFPRLWRSIPGQDRDQMLAGWRRMTADSAGHHLFLETHPLIEIIDVNSLPMRRTSDLDAWPPSVWFHTGLLLGDDAEFHVAHEIAHHFRLVSGEYHEQRNAKLDEPFQAWLDSTVYVDEDVDDRKWTELRQLFVEFDERVTAETCKRWGIPTPVAESLEQMLPRICLHARLGGASARHVWQQSESESDPFEVIAGTTIDAALEEAKARNYGDKSRGRSAPTNAETPTSAVRQPVVAGRIRARP